MDQQKRYTHTNYNFTKFTILNWKIHNETLRTDFQQPTVDQRIDSLYSSALLLLLTSKKPNIKRKKLLKPKL